MSQEVYVVEHVVCPQCGQELPVDVHDCPTCDRSRPAATPRGDRPAKQPARGPQVPIEDSPMLMALMLFFGIGPLALPMLWRGRAYSTGGKIVLTIAVFGLMILIAWLIWFVYVYQITPLIDELWR